MGLRELLNRNIFPYSVAEALADRVSALGCSDAQAWAMRAEPTRTPSPETPASVFCYQAEIRRYHPWETCVCLRGGRCYQAGMGKRTREDLEIGQLKQQRLSFWRRLMI